MKTYRTNLKTIVALVVLANVVHAVESRESEAPSRAERRMERLDGALQLSAEQKAQIETIWRKAESEIAALRDDDGLRKRGQRGEMREVLQEARAQVRGVLTPEQQKIFDAMPRGRNGGKFNR